MRGIGGRGTERADAMPAMLRDTSRCVQRCRCAGALVQRFALVRLHFVHVGTGCSQANGTVRRNCMHHSRATGCTTLWAFTLLQHPKRHASHVALKCAHKLHLPRTHALHICAACTSKTHAAAAVPRPHSVLATASRASASRASASRASAARSVWSDA